MEFRRVLFRSYVITNLRSTKYRLEYNSTLDVWQWVSVTNKNGATTTLSYNSVGNLEDITDPVNRTIHLNYTTGWTNDLVSEIILPDGVTTVSYAYNSGYTRSMTNVEYPNGDTASYLPGVDSQGTYVQYNEPFGPTWYRNAKVYLNSRSRVITLKDAATDRFKYGTRIDTDDDGDRKSVV